MQLLNIACGNRYHKDWINIDFYANNSDIKKVNILSGLPFKDNSFDVAYSSHFFEHLHTQDATFVISEVYRVLKKGGILRIVVPDLEGVCKEYIKMIDLASKNMDYKQQYEWMTLELLDQMVRVESGGNMGKLYQKITNEQNKSLADYILYRVGEDLLQPKNEIPKTCNFLKKSQKINVNFIQNKVLFLYLGIIRRLIPKNLRNIIFINTSIGEKHLWMYDKISLQTLFEKAGFKDIAIHRFNTSSIPYFNNYILDIKDDGTSYKGVSSIYMEGIK